MKRKAGRPDGTKLHGVIRDFAPEELKHILVEARRAGKKADLSIALTYYFALRVAETASLKLDDFRRSGRNLMLNVRALKAGKVTEFPVPEQIERKLKPWFKERDELPDADVNPYLFPHRFLTRTGHATPDSFKLAFQAILRRAKIEGRHSIHDLRHTSAQQMILDGEPLVKVQAWLRHRSAESTLRYLRKADIEGMARGAERRLMELIR